MAEANTSEPAKRSSRRSIVNYLAALALVGVVPSFIFAGVLIERNEAAQEKTVETLIVATARSSIQAVEREIAANITTLRVLASTPALRVGDYRGFYERSKLALAGSDTHLFIVDPDFSTFASTRLPYNSPRIPISDTDAAKRAFETRQVVISDLVFGAVSKLWVYNILMPVDLGLAGEKLIALNQPASNFASALSASGLPEGWNAALLDTHGQIIAGTPEAGNVGEQFAHFNAMEQPFSSGWQRLQSASGPAMGVIQRSSVTGWRLVVWASAATISQPLLNAMLSLIAGAFILLSLILAALYWVSRRIGSSVRGLARDARRLGAGEIVEAKPYPISEIAEVSDALAQASQDRQAAQSEVMFLMREVAHRSKNQMTVIAAMAKQTARGADDVVSYVENFERRIMGLARSTDLLLAHGRQGVLLGDLVTSQIAPFSPRDPGRVKIEGPQVRLNMQAAQIVGMALHELSTNAVKYGAFSGDEGVVTSRWALVGDKLDWIWRETVKRPQQTDARVGFGTTVLKTMVARSLGAQVERICHPDGIEWRFIIPLASIDPVQGPDVEQDLAAE
ncbi:sensor histidine kinase [Devosia submarina]|uniref:sensor histidine kinase n=1 Tax=Devosia submarina TaxID=1173082 RepID=UPI000D383CCC|nr:sensor histidine kinase [Devosia submarina]